ncbi:MAG: DNA primase [Leptonema sp. (in: bacteria)]
MYDLKERILQTIPIENYISRFVHLKKKGRYLVGLCPFHKEKTPSFTVTPEKGIFYCFGCGRGGNLITFVMEKEKISFQDALSLLASYAGIKSQSFFKENNKYYELLNFINQIYREFLFSKKGERFLTYIQSRGVGLSYLAKFQIGACSEDTQWILEKFVGEGKEAKIQDLIFLGILKKKESGEYVNFFGNRIIFPIFDSKQNTIGFGGRSINNSDKPKYLNSPDSSFFHKGSTLYGLNFAIKEIQKKNEVFLTEGYLDVIGLHQIGWENVIAPLGTAFTEEHKRLLLRYTKNIFLLLDGDQAGRNAIVRILNLFQEDLQSIKVILLPESKDPFDWSLEIQSGKEDLIGINEIKEIALTGFEFLIFYLILLEKDRETFFLEKSVLELNKKIKKFIEKDSLKTYYSSFTLNEKQDFLNKIKNFLLDFQNQFFRELFLQECKAITHWEFNNSFFLNREVDSKKIEKNLSDPIAKQENMIYLIEKEIVGFLLNHPEMIKSFAEDLEKITFYDEQSQLVYRTLYENYMVQENNIEIKEFLSFFPMEIQRAFVPYIVGDMENFYESKKSLEEKSDTLIKNIFREFLIRHRIEEINNSINIKQKEMILAEGEKKELYNQLNQLLKEKKELTSSLKGNL